MDWGRLTVGITAAVAFSVGAFRVATTDGALDGFALLAISLILVGISIALELHDRFSGEWHDQNQWPR